VIKRISIGRKRSDISHEEFVAHWVGPHTEIARRLPGLLGYVVLVATDPEKAGCDGIAITWFESREAADLALASEPIRSELAADRPKFLEEVRTFFAEEHVLVTPPSDGFS
jgi:uncharacterized protein (TIGR02118 family)